MAEIYTQGLTGISGISTPRTIDYSQHNWHLYAININESEFGLSRDRLIDELSAHNIGSSVHFMPVHLMSAYTKRFGYKQGDFPVTEQWFDGVLSLPLYPTMTAQDARDVVEAIREIQLSANRT